MDGVDTCAAAVTTPTAILFTGTTISDGGSLSRATPAGGPASVGNTGSAMARSGCADALRIWNLANTASGCSSSGTTAARNAHQPGGYATAREARILRRRHRLEGLERRLQKPCVCLFFAAGLTLGTNGEIRWTGAQRDADAVRSIVLVGKLQELLNFSFEGETAARMAQFDRDMTASSTVSNQRCVPAHYKDTQGKHDMIKHERCDQTGKTSKLRSLRSKKDTKRSSKKIFFKKSRYKKKPQRKQKVKMRKHEQKRRTQQQQEQIVKILKRKQKKSK